MKKLAITLAAVSALLLGVWVNQSLKVDFTTVDGQDYRWQSFEGQWVVVNYFAEWCAPCLREMPELNQFHLQHGNQIPIFAVSFDALTDQALSELTQKFSIQFPVMNSPKILPWQRPPQGLPTTYILGPDGKVKTQLKGEQTAESLFLAIQKLKAL